MGPDGDVLSVQAGGGAGNRGVEVVRRVARAGLGGWQGSLAGRWRNGSRWGLVLPGWTGRGRGAEWAVTPYQNDCF